MALLTVVFLPIAFLPMAFLPMALLPMAVLPMTFLHMALLSVTQVMWECCMYETTSNGFQSAINFVEYLSRLIIFGC